MFNEEFNNRSQGKYFETNSNIVPPSSCSTPVDIGLRFHRHVPDTGVCRRRKTHPPSVSTRLPRPVPRLHGLFPPIVPDTHLDCSGGVHVPSVGDDPGSLWGESRTSHRPLVRPVPVVYGEVLTGGHVLRRIGRKRPIQRSYTGGSCRSEDPM